MFLTLHLIDEPVPSPPHFATYIDDGAKRYGTTRNGLFCRTLQAHAENVMKGLYSYRQPVNGMRHSKIVTNLLLFYLTREEMIYMTKQPKKPLPTVMPSNLTFLNYRLTEEQLQEFDSLKITPAQLVNELVTAVTDGYRFSFSYNPEKKTANAMLADIRPNLPTCNHALSAYSDDCADAFKLLWFKHSICLERDWTPLLEQTTPTTRRRG